MIPKPQKPIRLCGKKLAQLNAEIHSRDGSCIVCGKWVDPGVKFHHVKLRSQGGSDTIENGVILCPGCHTQVHAGKNWQTIDKFCKDYLQKRYCTAVSPEECKNCPNELCDGDR